MSNTAKIVMLGAGSAAFGLSLYRDLFTTDELDGCTVTLVDTNPAALDRMYDLAIAWGGKIGTKVIFEKTTDRRAAFRDASFARFAFALTRRVRASAAQQIASSRDSICS